MKTRPIRIGIIAPSSVVPKVEFELGLEALLDRGYEVGVHPTVFGQHYFYPAADEERAQALIDFSMTHEFDALWCARGGYGATHLLPFLDRAKKKLKSAKKKTLLGYSDATALLEWFRVNLGWKTIHAPMPALRTFQFMSKDEWRDLETLLSATCQKKKVIPYSHDLTPVFIPKKFKTVTAPLVGGNLFVWNSLLGTKNVGNARGKLLFLEEVQENYGRIHRMIHHLEQAQGLKGVRAIVLGDFTDCPDSVAMGLKEMPARDEHFENLLKNPPKTALEPIRKILSPEEAFDFVFRSLGERTGIPVFKGCPVGHGANHRSLFLGKKHILNKNGRFSLGS